MRHWPPTPASTSAVSGAFRELIVALLLVLRLQNILLSGRVTALAASRFRPAPSDIQVRVARRGGWRPGTRPRWPLTALTLLANSSSARRAVNATSTTTSDAHERQFGDVTRTRTPARRRGVHTDRRSGDVRHGRIAGPATSGTDGSPAQRRRAHTGTGPATSGAHGHRSSDARCTRTPAQRRHAHTDTGPATSGTHGHRPSDVGRGRIAGPATSGAHGHRPGDAERTRNAGSATLSAHGVNGQDEVLADGLLISGLADTRIPCRWPGVLRSG
jgi:hypothetical protein